MDNLRGRGARRAAAKTAWRERRLEYRLYLHENFVAFWRETNHDQHNHRLVADQRRAQARRQSDADQAAR